MSAPFTDLSACDNTGNFPQHGREMPQTSLTGTGTDGSSTSGINNSINTTNEIRPRWDQRPLAPSTSGGCLTLSHMESTEYTGSEYETVYEYDENGVAVPTHQKKQRRMASPSVYSYNSARDHAQFVKDSYGRLVKLTLLNHFPRVIRSPSYNFDYGLS